MRTGFKDTTFCTNSIVLNKYICFCSCVSIPTKGESFALVSFKTIFQAAKILFISYGNSSLFLNDYKYKQVIVKQVIAVN